MYAGAGMALVRPRRRASAQEVTPSPPITGTTLRVLIPQHPLGSYDDALRNLGARWATAQGVTLQLDLIPEVDLPATIDAEIEDESGHDLIGTNLPLLHLAGDLQDLAPLADRLVELYGPPADASDLSTRLPDGRRPALSIAYAPAPLIYRRSVWERYGLPDGPATWDQLHETGSQLWHEEGMNLGFGLSREPGSERFAAMLLASFGGALLNEDGEVVIDSPESLEAVRFATALYRDAMSPESLDWHTDRPARLLADGIVSIVSDDISAIRLAQQRNQEIANDLFLAPPPAGPTGNAVTPASSYRAFHIPRFAANPDAAHAFILMLVASSAELVGGSQLADRAAYGSLVPDLVQAGGWLDTDPYGGQPQGKLAPLKTSAAWTVHPGSPAPASALASRAHAEFQLSRMLARAARGEVTPEESVAETARWLREQARAQTVIR